MKTNRVYSQQSRASTGAVRAKHCLGKKMEEKINIKRALEAFNIIREQGFKKDGHTIMNGVRASVGFDGYTISLGNDYVNLDIFFHNKFSISYTNRRERDLFLTKLDTILNNRATR